MIVRAIFVLCCVGTVLSECTYDSDKYSSYRGCVNRGHNGEVCGNWLPGGYWGDHHFINRNEAAANGIGNHNYCRNPGGQRYGGWCYKAYTREKVYCPVSDENCVTRPQDDPQCPEYTAPKKKSGKTEEEEEGEEEEEEVEPEIELIDAMLGGTLRMQCEEGCSDVVWEARPGLDTRRRTLNVLNVHPVTMETGGDWQCRCGRKQFVKKITICTVTWSECRRNGDFWLKQGRNSCTGAQTSGNCQPPEENNSEDDGEDTRVSSEYPHNQIWTTEKPQRQTEDRSGDAQARQEGEGEEGQACTGSKCGFCHRNSLLCGVLGCVAGALTVVAAVFVLKSLQWRRIAKESVRHGGGTMETHLAGSVAFSRHTADRSLVGYERALQIEDLVSQLGTRSRQQGYSCSTSMTNTLNLRQLRQQDQIGRIQSGALQSADNIACERYGEGELYMAQLEEEGFNQDAESVLRAEVEREELEREELEMRKGGTHFDKYYDQDVDKWSINEEMEI